MKKLLTLITLLLLTFNVFSSEISPQAKLGVIASKSSVGVSYQLGLQMKAFDVFTIDTNSGFTSVDKNNAVYFDIIGEYNFKDIILGYGVAEFQRRKHHVIRGQQDDYELNVLYPHKKKDERALVVNLSYSVGF